MTLFCPNCGKPNLDSATQCVACGTELRPKSPAKFKGTMMMSGVQIPQAGEAGAPPGPPPGAPPGGGFGGPPPGPPPG
ncbi:MAG: zinc ribbon domain-containing protein, partial [Sandaracinaceae bacterium]|nr:zinc ribbon domain-containing protein [Sandaracinaceae bacterium]